MTQPPETPQAAAATAATAETKVRRGRVQIVAVLSTVGAFGISAAQVKSLGDDPIVMILCGCLIAFVASTLRPGLALYLGPAAMAGFPVWAACDLFWNGGHNLLPFEFAFYTVYAGIGLAVAMVGAGLGWIARRCR